MLCRYPCHHTRRPPSSMGIWHVYLLQENRITSQETAIIATDFEMKGARIRTFDSA